MEFENFKWSLLEAVRGKLGEGMLARLNKIEKNNGFSYDGITIFKKESSLSPVIAVGPYYERYQGGGSLEDMAEEILEKYEEAIADRRMPFRSYPDYASVRESLFFRVINKEKNKLLLENVPSLTRLDLALVAYYSVDIGGEDDTVVMVRNEDIRRWKIEENVVLQKAVQNTARRDEVRLSSLSEMMKAMLPEEEEIPDPGLYVLSNEQASYGAGLIFLPGVPARISDVFRTDLMIIPSSVHEVLICPMADLSHAGRFGALVREVNQTQVPPQDILSDHVYGYFRESGTLKILDQE